MVVEVKELLKFTSIDCCLFIGFSVCSWTKSRIMCFLSMPQLRGLSLNKGVLLCSVSQIQLCLCLCLRCSASVWTIPIPARVLWHPTISEITITLSFSTSFVNRLHPTHASLLSISDYSYTRSRYHMIQFPLPHVYFTSPYTRFILPCVSLYLIFLLPCAHCHITNPYVSAFII